MKKLFDGMKKAFKLSSDEDPELMGDDEYVEIDTTKETESNGRVLIKPYTLEDFTDIRQILDQLKQGNSIALINIKPLKDKDIIEVKRAINKLKKMCEANEGSIAGFGENWVVVTPRFAEIERVDKEQNSANETT